MLSRTMASPTWEEQDGKPALQTDESPDILAPYKSILVGLGFHLRVITYSNSIQIGH